MKGEGERLLKGALQNLIGSREGCYLLGLFFERSGVDKPSIDVNNPNVMYANEGRRGVGLWLKGLLCQVYGPGAYSKCLDVYKNVTAADAKRQNRERAKEKDETE
ncbi:hypothetical protein [Cloacibacillus evryensis]|uniref:hypothetical protein n=1 Tax=Cloacibacillus evryensis TaxID=508460 RepID=UPI00241D1AF0|nr:hypothetical protein [Cloacibacillus evryensis]